MRKIYTSLIFVLTCLVAFPQVNQDTTSADTAVSDTTASQPADSLDMAASEMKSCPVYFNRDTLFILNGPLDSLSALQRCRAAESSLTSLMSYEQLNHDLLKTKSSQNGITILYDSLKMVTVTPSDAELYGESLKDTAKAFSDQIRREVIDPRTGFELMTLLSRLGLILVIVLLIVVLVRLINWLFAKLQHFVDTRIQGKVKPITYRNAELLTSERLTSIITIFLRVSRVVAILLAAYLSIPLVLSLFPFTQDLSQKLFSYVADPFTRLGENTIKYLPNLITIFIVVLFTHFALRIARFFYIEVERGNLVIPGFYADWARVTFNIMRILIYVVVFIFLYPYLPGSESKVFQGVLIFLGLLLLVGSYSAISNVVSGILLTYMRPFRPGDRVRIDDVTGIVRGRNLLVTRLRTDNNEEITLPNSKVLNGHTKNYSGSARLHGILVFVKLKVHFKTDLDKLTPILLEAADEVDDLAKHPKPFVIFEEMQGQALIIRLKAHLKESRNMTQVKSQMLKKVVHKLRQEDIQLMP